MDLSFGREVWLLSAGFMQRNKYEDMKEREGSVFRQRSVKIRLSLGTVHLLKDIIIEFAFVVLLYKRD